MKDEYVGALLEDINGKIDRLAEAMADVPADVRQLKVSVGKLEADMQVVKAAVTDQNQEVRGIDKRLTRLENAA